MQVICDLCRRIFNRDNRRVNEALKFGWKQYCSQLCLIKNKSRAINRECFICTKSFLRIPSQLRKSKSNNYFCSQTCAAIYNNRVRSDKKPINICKIVGCNKRIPRSYQYCSITCAGISRRKDLNITKIEILNKIITFSRNNGRIPVKKEMYDIYKKARNSFGSWNGAIKAAGFKPNPVMFSHKYVARDGHRCDSLAEKIIDEWFYAKGIKHDRSIPYPEFKKMTCDFVAGGYFIEFFGLDG